MAADINASSLIMNSLDEQGNVETQHGGHQPTEGTILTDAGITGEALSHDDDHHHTRRILDLPGPTFILSHAADVTAWH